jgi:hypothetical protein
MLYDPAWQKEKSKMNMPFEMFKEWLEKRNKDKG